MQESARLRGYQAYLNPERIGLGFQPPDQAAQIGSDTGMRHGEEIAINGDGERRVCAMYVAMLHIEA